VAQEGEGGSCGPIETRVEGREEVLATFKF
jgi:hypothetical protein